MGERERGKGIERETVQQTDSKGEVRREGEIGRERGESDCEGQKGVSGERVKVRGKWEREKKSEGERAIYLRWGVIFLIFLSNSST